MWVCSDRRNIRIINTETTPGRSWCGSSSDVSCLPKLALGRQPDCPHTGEEESTPASRCCDLQEKRWGESLKAIVSGIVSACQHLEGDRATGRGSVPLCLVTPAPEFYLNLTEKERGKKAGVKYGTQRGEKMGTCISLPLLLTSIAGLTRKAENILWDPSPVSQGFSYPVINKLLKKY